MVCGLGLIFRLEKFQLPLTFFNMPLQSLLLVAERRIKSLIINTTVFAVGKVT